MELSGNRFLCVVLGICAYQSVVSGQKSDFGMVFQWSQLEFDYPTPQDRQADIDSGVFIPNVPAPIDVQPHYSSEKKIFVTIPRFQAGIPVTLGTVSSKQLNGNPLIEPFPSWEWHRNPTQCNQNRLVSVYRVALDECDRLWVLDTGRYIDQQICPAQILAFDLKTNQLINSYQIPSDQIEARSILVTPVVDVRDSRGKCRDTFVYVADCQAFSIIVYDVSKNRSWRVIDKSLYPFPTFGTYTIQGESFDLMDGVLGMALSTQGSGSNKKLFFHAMSSNTESWVFTSDLTNETRFRNDPSSSPQIFHTFRKTRSTQSAAEAMDKDGIMYYGLMSEVAIGCWNTQTEYGDQNDIIAQNDKTLQFASGVKIVNNKKGDQELWILTSRFQKVATGSITPSEINFRIQAAKVDDLVFGTRCKVRGHGYGLRPKPKHIRDK